MTWVHLGIEVLVSFILIVASMVSFCCYSGRSATAKEHSEANRTIAVSALTAQINTVVTASAISLATNGILVQLGGGMDWSLADHGLMAMSYAVASIVLALYASAQLTTISAKYNPTFKPIVIVPGFGSMILNILSFERLIFELTTL